MIAEVPALLDHNNLEEFSDPINYDFEDPSDTGVAFYSALAQEAGGPVLEIACGTGRVTIPIARLGFHVTGLDIVPGMLEQARRKSAGLPVRWLEGDARTFALPEQFRLIFLHPVDGCLTAGHSLYLVAMTGKEAIQ